MTKPVTQDVTIKVEASGNEGFSIALLDPNRTHGRQPRVAVSFDGGEVVAEGGSVKGGWLYLHQGSEEFSLQEDFSRSSLMAVLVEGTTYEVDLRGSRAALSALWNCVAEGQTTPTVGSLPSDVEFAEYLKNQLTCMKPPEPVISLTYLDQSNLLLKDSRVVVDSISCWDLVSPLVVEGMSFTGVCAASDEPFLLAMYPNYFSRGPGTSNGTRVSFLTEAPMSVASAWAEEVLKLDFLQGEHFGMRTAEGKVELICSLN